MQRNRELHNIGRKSSGKGSVQQGGWPGGNKPPANGRGFIKTMAIHLAGKDLSPEDFRLMLRRLQLLAGLWQAAAAGHCPARMRFRAFHNGASALVSVGFLETWPKRLSVSFLETGFQSVPRATAFSSFTWRSKCTVVVVVVIVVVIVIVVVVVVIVLVMAIVIIVAVVVVVLVIVLVVVIAVVVIAVIVVVILVIVVIVVVVLLLILIILIVILIIVIVLGA